MNEGSTTEGGFLLRQMGVVLLLCGILAACVLFLRPDLHLARPFLIAAFFQFHMSVYVKERAITPPRAYGLFAYVAFAGMMFLCLFLLLVWYVEGFRQAFALFTTTTAAVVALTLAARIFERTTKDLTMLIDFAGLGALPVAAGIALLRLL